MSNKSHIEELNEDIKEDFLDVDKPIPGQNFVCLSFVSPDKILGKKDDYYYHEFNKKRFQTFQKEFNEKFDKVMNDCLDGKVDLGKLNELQQVFNKSSEEHIKQSFDKFTDDLKDFKYANEETIEEMFHKANDFQTSVRGVKVRGVYNTMREAEIRCKVLQRMDPTFHIFLGQVGYWLPWDPTADKVENQEYLNDQLNDIVKKYKVNEAKRDDFYEQQKQEKKKATIKKIIEKDNQAASFDQTADQLTQEDPWMARRKEAAEAAAAANPPRTDIPIISEVVDTPTPSITEVVDTTTPSITEVVDTPTPSITEVVDTPQ
jgi:hypothetical protein